MVCLWRCCRTTRRKRVNCASAARLRVPTSPSWRLKFARDALDAPCRVVLHPSYYNLLFVEHPDGIEDADVDEAVRWKVKDLVEESLESVIIDTFPVPEDAFKGRSRMLYAVAARRALI